MKTPFATPETLETLETLETPETPAAYVPEYLHRWELPKHYFGATWDGYFVGPVTRHRDSDLMTVNNWEFQEAVAKRLDKEIPFELSEEEEDAAGGKDLVSRYFVREGHCLVGWVEWFAIHETDHAALREFDAIAKRLENYPSLDDDRLSEKEVEEADRIWRECYNARERIEYIREHRSQFEFSTFAEMRECCRGKYFMGYASELVYN